MSKSGSVFMLAALVVAGCVSSAGAPEFRVYAQTIDSLAAATDPLADRLRVAERRTALKLIDENGEAVAGARAGASVRGLASGFDPAHAPYLAESGDPPFAAAIRASIASLRRFNAAALIYAEGRGLDAAMGDLLSLKSELEGGFLAVGVAAPPLGAAFAVALEGVSFLGASGSREAFRTILREEGGRLDALLEKLVDVSPEIYLALTLNDFERREAMVNAGSDLTEITARIRAERRLMAEWVILIQLARRLLADSRAALDAPRGAGDTLAAAAGTAAEVQTRLDRIRTLIAGGG